MRSEEEINQALESAQDILGIVAGWEADGMGPLEQRLAFRMLMMSHDMESQPVEFYEGLARAFIWVKGANFTEDDLVGDEDFLRQAGIDPDGDAPEHYHG